MNDPLMIRFKHNGMIFIVDPYYDPIPIIGSIESPIDAGPMMPDNPGW